LDPLKARRVVQKFKNGLPTKNNDFPKQGVTDAPLRYEKLNYTKFKKISKSLLGSIGTRISRFMKKRE
jgi:hypothetical protein